MHGKINIRFVRKYLCIETVLNTRSVCFKPVIAPRKRSGPHYKVQPVKVFNNTILVFPTIHTKLVITFCWKTAKQ